MSSAKNPFSSGVEHPFQPKDETTPDWVLTRLDVAFGSPADGWIDLKIGSLTGDPSIGCSAVDDPFENLLLWLEQIAGGAEHAIWHIAEEGPSSRLIFMQGDQFVGDHASYLACVRSEDGEVTEFKAVPTERVSIVRSFYEAFRAMVVRSDYDPRHWEIHPEWHNLDQGDEEAFEQARYDWPFEGHQLSRMRSQAIEQFLQRDDGPSDQLELELLWC